MANKKAEIAYKQYVDEKVNSVSEEVKASKVSATEIIKVIEKAFDVANKKFYNGELERPVITVAPDEKQKTYGHVTIGRVWHVGEVSKVELNIVPNMIEDHKQVAGTLLHEMVHIYNLQQGVKDCSGHGNFYHNAKFGEVGNAHGLKLEKGKKYGFSGHELNEQGLAFAESLKEDLSAFKRDTVVKAVSKKTRNYRFYCPSCGCKCYSSKKIAIICEDCNERMICANAEDED